MVWAAISLWHIRDLENEALSGIKDPNGKQLILLEPGRRETRVTPVMLDGMEIHSSLQIVLPNFSKIRVRAKGRIRRKILCILPSEDGKRSQGGMLHVWHLNYMAHMPVCAHAEEDSEKSIVIHLFIYLSCVLVLDFS